MAEQTPTCGACDQPPEGWRCTRGAGHDGPCAALPAPGCGPQAAMDWREEADHYRSAYLAALEAISRHQSQIKAREAGRRVSSVVADEDLWRTLPASDEGRG